MRIRSCIRLVLLTILLDSSSIEAATWLVSKDGHGHFTTIQEAVDISSPGDIIEIAPGRYDDRELQTIGAWTREMIAIVHHSSITIRGLDRETVLIGPEVPMRQRYDDPIGLMTSWGASGFVVENLTIENLRHGAACVDAATFRNVTFRENDTGLHLERAGANVINCDFVNNSDGINAWNTAFSEIVDSRFLSGTVGAIFYSDAVNTDFNRCHFEGMVVGINFQQRAGGRIRNSTFQDCFNYGLATTWKPAEVELLGNRFVGNGAASVIAQEGSITGSRNVFKAGSYSTLMFERGVQVVLHDNHISIDSENPSVWVRAYRDHDPPLHLDLRNNYWFTDKSDLIAEKIWDGHDDPNETVLVDYVPFAGQRVPTRAISMGALKERFGQERK